MHRRIGTLGVIAALVAVVGLVALQTGASAGEKLKAKKMSGEKELDATTLAPGAGDPDGRGRAKVWATDADTLCFKLHWNKIGDPSAAHIHTGTSTENGAILVGLYMGDPLSGHNLTGCVDTTAENVTNIFANPSGFYVNVHNSEFPGGAIRGQLS